MGRLENIIARNQRGRRPTERTVVMFVFGALLLVILSLMVFTDLGIPRAEDAPEPNQPSQPNERRVDGVLLGSPKPSQPPPAPPRASD